MKRQAFINMLKELKEAVIAIDGPSACGKTTLANDLKHLYGVTVIHMDDYFLPALQRTNEIAGNIDFERLNKEVFNNINQPYIQSNHYNCKTNTLEKQEQQKRAKIIIIEGAYSMHPSILKNYSMTVFIEVDESIQKDRIIKRNGQKKYMEFKNTWIPRENQYFDKLAIKKQANIIIKEN
jgi:uridine kinase